MKRSVSASASVVQPVFVFFVFGMPSVPKSTSWSCLGEPRLIFSPPIASHASCWACATLAAKSPSRESRPAHVDGDAGALHAGQHVDERDLDLGQELLAPGGGDLLVEHGGEVAHGGRAHHLLLGGLLVGVAAEVEHALTVGRAPTPLSSRCRLRSTRSSRW